MSVSLFPHCRLSTRCLSLRYVILKTTIVDTVRLLKETPDTVGPTIVTDGPVKGRTPVQWLTTLTLKSPGVIVVSFDHV